MTMTIMYVCRYVHVYICEYVRIYIDKYVHTYICAYIHKAYIVVVIQVCYVKGHNTAPKSTGAQFVYF